jgi:hypothetical protein
MTFCDSQSINVATNPGGAAKFCRRAADDPAKDLAEMRSIGKAKTACQIREGRWRGLPQPFHGNVNPLVEDESVRRHAMAFGKRLAEIGGAQSQNTGKLCDRHITSDVLSHIVEDDLVLARRQASLEPPRGASAIITIQYMRQERDRDRLRKESASGAAGARLRQHSTEHFDHLSVIGDHEFKKLTLLERTSSCIISSILLRSR